MRKLFQDNLNFKSVSNLVSPFLVYINTENFDKIEKIAESCVIYV